MQKILSASLLALAIAAPFAQAHEAGDVILRAGVATVAPQEDSSTLKLDGASAAGTSAGLDNNSQLGLTAVYMVNDNVGVELLAATPFQHTVSVKGVSKLTGIAGLDGDLADVKHLPPTLSLQYFPLGGASKFQPHVGVGLNYTTFFQEELSSTAKAAGFSDLSLDDSFGLALQAGFDYMLTDKIMVNAAVWKIDIDTTATIDGPTALGVKRTKVDVDVDPYAYMVGVGYKF